MSQIEQVLSEINEATYLDLQDDVIPELVAKINEVQNSDTNAQIKYAMLATLADMLIGYYEQYGMRIGKDAVALARQLSRDPKIKAMLKKTMPAEDGE